MSIKPLSLQDYQGQKINLLPIMIAQQFVLLPLYFYIPIWVTLLNISMVVVVYLSRVKQRFLFHPRLRNVITLFAAAGILYSFHRLTGRDAGVALIATMYGLKITEIKSNRDVYVLMLLGFFLMTGGFLFNQSPWIAIYQFIPVAAILNALISINSLTNLHLQQPFQECSQQHLQPKANKLVQLSLSFTLKQLTKYLLLAIPLMLVFFVFFPRLSGPIWNMPGGAKGSSGVSDSMTPGSISDLQLFDKVAFRVKYYDKTPSGAEMYWRVLVLDQFDGLTWTRHVDEKEATIKPYADLNRRTNKEQDYRSSKDFYRYDLSLEATKQSWLVFLDRPADIPNRTKLYPDYSVKVEHRLLDRTRYSAESLIGLKLNVELSRQQRIRNTRIPEDNNRRSAEWAKDERQLYSSDKAFILGLLAKINQQEYFYTLQPPIMQRDSVDSFWFDHQRGFCEHYAGALVFMARAANIPARVVVGYQGAERNPLSDYWIVRYANAHAWTEIWYQNEGWVRVDPTAAIAPHRIEAQLLQDYRQRDSLFDDFDFIAVDLDHIGWVKQFEYWMDKANSGWNDWILDYNRDSQRRLFKGLGLEKLTGQQAALFMIAILAVFLFLISFRWIRNRPVLDSIQISFQLLQKKLAKVDLALADHQGVNGLIEQLERALSTEQVPVKQVTVEQADQLLPLTQSSEAGQKTLTAKADSKAPLIRVLKLYRYLRYQRVKITVKQQSCFRQQVKRLNRLKFNLSKNNLED